MKIKSLILGVATAVIVPVATVASPVLADSPGQVGAGDIYSVKNLTQNTKYAKTASANACEELEYSVLLHNPGYGTINNVVVKATLPASASTTNTSNVTITYTDGIGSPVNDSATVNLTSAQSISYSSGSSVLFGTGGTVIKTLPDGVTNGGVNIGSLPGSTTEYVNFKAKVNCPEQPTCKTTPSLCPPVTPPKTPPAPTTLVNTGPGEVAALFAVAMIAGTIGYRKYLSYRLGRQ